VTLLDAGARPGGLAGGRRPGFELGIKGCWRHYSNVRNLVQQLGLDMDELYGPYAETAFVSARGVEVVSPVLGELPRLPAPLGTLVHTHDRFRMLPLDDRLSALPLTRALLEFDLSEATYSRYDAISFAELCEAAGVSPRLRRRFLDPLLVALMFAPPEELSAAAALSVLNSYALAHQSDFDVRWPRRPPSLLFNRWRSRLEAKGARVRAGAPVAEILADNSDSGKGVVSGVRLVSGEMLPASAVVLAVGPSALPKIVAASPALQKSPQLTASAGLSTVDVCAVRIWPSERAQIPRSLPRPSNVFCGVPGAPRNLGGTIYDLGALMGGRDVGEEDGGVAGAFEVDVYNAGSLTACSEDELVDFARRALSTAAGRAWLDVDVERAAFLRGKALHFAPGSHGAMPTTEPPGAPRGLFIAGDCVKQGPGEVASHRGARGLSQEKALVTGLQAAAAAAELQGLPPRPAQQAEADEPHIAAAKRAALLFTRA